MRIQNKARKTLAALALSLLVIACAAEGARRVPQHAWWFGRGPVLPHKSFPTDCRLCHTGEAWQELREDFEYDHEAETGVALDGAHADAECLRCHNDRGPAAVFEARGCAGCHEDIHIGQLGNDCEKCHTESTWRPEGQVALHNRTRFPLIGVHASTDCRRCHPGAEIGRFVPTDVECVTCHANDLAAAINPPHIALGFVDRCDRCHLPTTWNQAQFNPAASLPSQGNGDPWRELSRSARVAVDDGTGCIRAENAASVVEK